MDFDEPRAKLKPDIEVGADLSSLSVAELEHRIEMLKAEIGRIETALAEKRRHTAAASALFKS